MHPSPRRRSRWLPLLLLVGGCAGAAGLHAQEPDAADQAPQFPPGLQIDVLGKLRVAEDGSVESTGPVTITWRGSRIQADRMTLRERRYIEAEGNVLIIWGRSRLFGARMRYDLEQETGDFEDVIGQTLDDYLFWAKRVKKIGERKLRLKSATVTTCTQPVPYWSFSVSSATITIDKYARMWNVRLRAGRVPVIYLPYLVWPVKDGRAVGLLMPEMHSEQRRGQQWSQQLFIPIGRSADLTLEGRYYTQDVAGGGGELRLIPNSSGRVKMQGFYLNDPVYAQQRDTDGRRYWFAYRQEQRFLNGFRMVADIDLVSDTEYFSDFERDLNLAAAPQTLARLEFTRNGRWASMNVRELRREQLSSGLVQQTLPEIEWRGRNTRLGRSPIYLSFEAAAASIQQQRETDPGEPTFRPDYLRGDLRPTLSLPASPLPWLDITPQVSFRETYYTQRQTPDGEQVVDRSLSRGLWAYGVEVTGPKVFRIYGSERGGGRRYKHSLEPRLRYGFEEAFDRVSEVLPYDEVDRFSGSGTQLSYGIVQRLFARRPRAQLETPAAAESVQLPDGTMSETSGASAAAPGEPAPASEPVEIASLELTQSRSFDRDVSSGIVGFTDSDGDGVLDQAIRESSPRSPVQITGRFNPGPAVSLDLRSRYDVIFDEIGEVSLSGSVRSSLAQARFTLVHRKGLNRFLEDGIERKTEDATQMRLTTQVGLADGRLALRLDGSYDANPFEGASHFPEQRWQVEYTTQCCTFFLERLTREFGTQTENRRELHFRLDLRGVGKILSSTF